MLWFGSGMVKSGAISIGDMTSFLLYTAYAGASLTGLSNVYSELMKAVGAGSRLFDMQDSKPTISPTVGLPVKSARGPIRFEHLSFNYPTRPGVKIFDDLNFEILGIECGNRWTLWRWEINYLVTFTTILQPD